MSGRLCALALVLVGFSACSSSNPDDAMSGQTAICTAGQVSGCKCSDGREPGVTGCEVASSGTAGRAASGGSTAAGSSAGAGSVSTMQARAPVAGMNASVQAGSGGASNTTPAAGGGGTAPAAGSGGSSAAGGVAAPAAGSGGSSAAGAAGHAASGGMASIKDCGEAATMGKDRKAATKMAGGGRHSSGSTDFKVKAGNRYTRLQTTLEVPARPNGNSTLFMWPGLEPLEGISMNFAPIGRGVLQPVLTWGTSCAPGGRTAANNYWISGMYVNISAQDRMYNGCFGGKVMDVKMGDKLYMDMFLKDDGTTWSQVVKNLSNNQTVDFDIDLKKQDQNWALFEIEVSSSTLPASDVIFTDTVLTMANPEPEACEPDAFGPMDYYTAPLTSADGTKCCIERIVLREEGVAASTKDP